MLALPLCISLWDGSLVHSKQAVHASRNDPYFPQKASAAGGINVTSAERAMRVRILIIQSESDCHSDHAADSRKLCRSVREDLFLQSIQPFQYVLDYTLCAWVQRLNLLSK